MWNPDADADDLLAEFYPKFYGPAAKPMAAYWTAIYKAWEDTIVTEHEYFVAPAIYTPELVATLRKHLEAAEAVGQAAGRRPDDDANERILDRVRFTRLGFEVLDAYMAMVHAAATEVDYKAAVAAGERGLAAREKLTDDERHVHHLQDRRGRLRLVAGRGAAVPRAAALHRRHQGRAGRQTAAGLELPPRPEGRRREGGLGRRRRPT